jgi:hypothetical protein
LPSADQAAIVEELLIRFKAVMKVLEQQFPGKVILVDTQSIIPTTSKDFFLNEIHLTSHGYQMIGRSLVNTMRQDYQPACYGAFNDQNAPGTSRLLCPDREY